MEQTNSNWTRWIAIALCALALNMARRADETAPRQVVAHAAAVNSRAAAPQSAALAGNASDPR
jgi:hypothetical protein